MTISAIDIRRTTNMFGPLDEEAQQRLQAVITSPTPETWDAACSLILNARTMVTLWQAVIAVEPTFTKSIDATDRWSMSPSQETLLAALRYAVNPPVVTCDMDPGKPGGAGSYHHGEHEQTASCSNPRMVTS